MVMVNNSGMIEMVNTQTEIVFGYTRSELLGQPVAILVPERFRLHHPGLAEAFLRAPCSRPMGAGRDLYGLRRDGTEFPMEIGLNPITTEAGVMVLSAIIDISDRKQKEESVSGGASGEGNSAGRGAPPGQEQPANRLQPAGHAVGPHC